MSKFELITEDNWQDMLDQPIVSQESRRMFLNALIASKMEKGYVYKDEDPRSNLTHSEIGIEQDPNDTHEILYFTKPIEVVEKVCEHKKSKTYNEAVNLVNTMRLDKIETVMHLHKHCQECGEKLS